MLFPLLGALGTNVDFLELEKRLIEEGCNPRNIAIQTRSDDAYCLDKINGFWSVFYSERGRDSSPIFSTDNKEEAAEFYFKHILKQQHWHIVGFFKNETLARNLQSKLDKFGIKYIRNDIPSYKFVGDKRYRVFVVGKDIFKVREKLGNLEAYGA